jgi:tetratricopeptide (TPR) repeat protein
MRFFAFLLTFSLSLATQPLWAQEPARPKDQAPATKPAAPRVSTLDELYERLAKAENEQEAQGISNLIDRRLSRSGSDTADLLLARATQAYESKDFPLAVELLDRVLALQPGWAEAWYRRATIFYQLDDPIGAMADLHHALKIEPRHFGAWAGLGHILMASEDKARALEAYRRALKINPQFPTLQTLEKRLSQEVGGQDL